MSTIRALAALPFLVSWYPATPASECIAQALSYETAPEDVRIPLALEGGGSGYLRIEVLTEHIARVRINRSGAFAATLQEKDGFINTAWPRPRYQFQADAGGYRIDAGGLHIEVGRRPFALRFQAGGRLLTASAASRPVCFAEDTATFAMQSPAGERFLGFGYHGARVINPFPADRSPFDHRGHFILVAGMSNPRHHYVPFFLSSKGYGLFLNTLALSSWDMAKTAPDRYSVEVDDGELDLFVIAGPRLKDILERYSTIVGRAPLPPKWELGGERLSRLNTIDPEDRHPDEHFDIRWADQKQIQAAARAIRRRREIVDYFHLDSEWQTVRNSFEWVAQVPDPKGMIALLNSLHFKVGLWQRPTPNAAEYRLFLEAEKNGYLVKGPDGRTFRQMVFNGERTLVDFTNPEAVRWWQRYVEEITALGVRAWMLDSESSGFSEHCPEVRDLKFHNGMSGREMENYHSPLYLKTVWDAFRKSLGGKRATLHIYHQTYFAGNRYPYMGVGDRASRMLPPEALRSALNLAMIGVPCWMGVEVSSFGLPHAGIEHRVRLIPYTYSHWKITADTGLPIIRPMALIYDDDPESYNATGQYMFGSEFLVAPRLDTGTPWRWNERTQSYVEAEHARSWDGSPDFRRIYLPKGVWTNYWTKEKYLGPGWRHLQIQPGRDPILVRQGAIIPMGPLTEFVEQKPLDPLTLEIYADGESRFTLYEDDGETYEYESGRARTTEIRSVEDGRSVRVEIGAAKGSFRGALESRSVELNIYGVTRPGSVRLGDRELPELRGEAEFEKAPEGWFYRVRAPGYNRAVMVRLPAAPAGAPQTVQLEGSRAIRYYF